MNRHFISSGSTFEYGIGKERGQPPLNALNYEMNLVAIFINYSMPRGSVIKEAPRSAAYWDHAQSLLITIDRRVRCVGGNYASLFNTH